MIKIERAHYDMWFGMYYDREEFRHFDDDPDSVPDWSFVSSSDISDPTMNHAKEINTKDPERVITEATERFLAIERKPSFYITPNCSPSDLEERLSSKGFRISSIDAWMFFARQGSFRSVPQMGLWVVKSRDEMGIFGEIYRKAFSSGQGPYSFPPEYANAVVNSIGRQRRGVEVTHYVAHLNYTPAGILSLIRSRDIYGIYNVGTAPEFQRRGIGTALTLTAIKKASDSGAQTIFLQTEAASKNEIFYKKLGFETKFYGTFMVKEE